MPAKYVQVHMTGHPFVVGCLHHNSPHYHGDIHTTPCHDKEYHPTYSIQQLQYLEDNKYMGLTKVLHWLGDVGLEAEIHRLCNLWVTEDQILESIKQLENNLFYTRLRKHKCKQQLEDADAVRRLEEEETCDQGVMRVTTWEVEQESHTISHHGEYPDGHNKTFK
jgi:hypothetical protein